MHSLMRRTSPWLGVFVSIVVLGVAGNDRVEAGNNKLDIWGASTTSKVATTIATEMPKINPTRTVLRARPGAPSPVKRAT